ncbi:MAG: DinB family protein [Planctomycetota bacterium]
MSEASDRRPDSTEYAPYYETYVGQVPDGPIVDTLLAQGERLVKAWRAMPAAARGFRYAEGKWTVEEVLGHVVDIERVFSHRAMWFLRGIPAEQPGVDQDVMVPNADSNARGIESLCVEFESLRRSNVELFRGLSDARLDVRGRASGVEFSVRGTAFVLCGHAEHHARVLEERYLTAL